MIKVAGWMVDEVDEVDEVPHYASRFPVFFVSLALSLCL